MGYGIEAVLQNLYRSSDKEQHCRPTDALAITLIELSWLWSRVEVYISLTCLHPLTIRHPLPGHPLPPIPDHMARNKSPKGYEVPSIPLADFFWIAGVDGQDIFDTYVRLGNISNSTNGAHGPGFGDTIEEDQDAEQEVSSILESPRPMSRHSRRNSYQRLSRFSDEARMSVRSLDKSLADTGSKRSSVTIRPLPSPGPRASVLLSDADFDKALKQFATDRDSFFLDLNFSAGAVTQPNRPRVRPKTQKIVAEDIQPASISRGIGSIRRHMSFREMNSVKRQPSVARNGSSNLLRYFPLQPC